MTIIKSKEILDRLKFISKNGFKNNEIEKYLYELYKINNKNNCIIIDFNMILQLIIDGSIGKKFKEFLENKKKIEDINDDTMELNEEDLFDKCSYINNKNEKVSFFTGNELFQQIKTYINFCFSLPFCEIVVVILDTELTNEAKGIIYKTRYKGVLPMKFKDDEAKQVINDNFFPLGKYFLRFKRNKICAKQINYYIGKKFMENYEIINESQVGRQNENKKILFDSCISYEDMIKNVNNYFCFQKKEKKINTDIQKEKEFLCITKEGEYLFLDNNNNNNIKKKTSSCICEGEHACFFYVEKFKKTHNCIVISRDGDAILAGLIHTLNRIINFENNKFYNETILIKENIGFKKKETCGIWNFNILINDLFVFYKNKINTFLDIKNNEKFLNKIIDFETLIFFFAGNDFFGKICEGIGINKIINELFNNIKFYKNLIKNDYFILYELEPNVKIRYCKINKKLFFTFIKNVYNCSSNKKISLSEMENKDKDKKRKRKDEKVSINLKEEKLLKDEMEIKIFIKNVEKKYNKIILKKKNKFYTENEIKRFIKNYTFIYFYFFNVINTRIQNDKYTIKLNPFIKNNKNKSLWGYKKNNLGIVEHCF